MAGAVHSEQQVDGAAVRVSRWRLEPGGWTGHHVHEYPYVVVPLTDGDIEMRAAEGPRAVVFQAGQAYFRPAGVEHDVGNAGERDVVFVEVEMKAADPGAVAAQLAAAAQAAAAQAVAEPADPEQAAAQAAAGRADSGPAAGEDVDHDRVRPA